MEVLLKCNWTVKSFEKPKLLHKGPNYKFEVQSSYGCVKTPVSCIQKKDFLTFNLAGLTTKNGTIVTNSTILFHICGDLDLKGPKNNSCHLQNSQVCEIKGRNYLNRGMLFISINNQISVMHPFTNINSQPTMVYLIILSYYYRPAIIYHKRLTKLCSVPQAM